MNNDPFKVFKNICFKDKEIETQTKIANHGFMKIWSNFNYSKVLNY